MGATHVTVAVSNPADSSKRWEGLFLVDTGATDCYIPAKHLHAVGIKAEGQRTYELADGSLEEYEFGLAEISFMGEITAGRVIFGPDNVEPLLGVTALESVGIIVVHISNRYLDLEPVVAAIAKKHDYLTRTVHKQEEGGTMDTASDWILVTKSKEFLDQPAVHDNSEPLKPEKELLWTDQHTALFPIMK